MTTLEDEVRELRQLYEELKLRMISVNSLGDFETNDLGDMEHFNLTVKTLDGLIRMIHSGEDLYDLIGLHCHFVGFNDNGEAQFWVNAEEGSLDYAAGAGKLNRLGILMTGLNFVIQQTATNEAGENQRVGRLEMFVPPGSDVPAWGVTFSDSAESLVRNGDFEDGDLTGWNTSDTDYFEVIADAKLDGSFGLHVKDVESGTKTLTSNRFPVNAGKPYRISLDTKEYQYKYYENVILPAVLALTINDEDYVYTDDPPLANSRFLFIGTYQDRVNRSFIKCDLSAVNSLATIHGFKLYYWIWNRASSGLIGTMYYRLVLRAITEDMNWSTYDGANSWAVAGAGSTASDASYIDDLALSGGSSNVWASMPLGTSVLENWLNGSVDNNGIMLNFASADEATAQIIYGRTYNPPYFLATISQLSDYTISIKFYDAASGGTLLGTTVLCNESNQTIVRTAAQFLTPPDGATHAEIVIEVSKGFGFYVDNINVSYSTSIHFNDQGLNLSGKRFLHHNQDESCVGRFPSAIAQLHPPYTLPSIARASGGSLSYDPYYMVAYKVAFVDADGITTLKDPTSYVTLTSTYRTVSITNIPIGPHGTVGRALFRTYYKPVTGEETDIYRIDIDDNTTTSYTDDGVDDDPEKDSTLPTVNTTLGRPVMPTQITWYWDEVKTSNSLERVIDTAQLFGFYFMPSSAGSANNGTTYSFEGWCAAGTYTLKTLGQTHNGHAITDIYLDGVLIASGVDWYSSTQVRNVIKETTGVIIPTSGWHVLTYKINGDNPSSNGNFYIRMTKSMLQIES